MSKTIEVPFQIIEEARRLLKQRNRYPEVADLEKKHIWEVIRCVVEAKSELAGEKEGEKKEQKIEVDSRYDSYD